jgi:type I restriction enzyme S subunit
MKDSGVEWLGAVPVRWKIKAIKWATPVQRGASPRPIDDPSYFDDDGEYAWVRISDVTAAGMYLDATEQRLSDLGSSLSVKMQPGSLFLSIAGSVGKPCIANINCCIHDGFVYFPLWKGDSRFLFYVFASGEPYKGLGKMGTQLNLNTDTVGSIVIGIPDAAEQRLIADYLDRTTAELDSMTTAVEAAIDRLTEYRQALITSAVTGKIDVRGRQSELEAA